MTIGSCSWHSFIPGNIEGAVIINKRALESQCILLKYISVVLETTVWKFVASLDMRISIILVILIFLTSAITFQMLNLRCRPFSHKALACCTNTSLQSSLPKVEVRGVSLMRIRIQIIASYSETCFVFILPLLAYAHITRSTLIDSPEQTNSKINVLGTRTITNR